MNIGSGPVQLPPGYQVRVQFIDEDYGNCPGSYHAYYFNGDTIDLQAPSILFIDQPGIYQFDTYVGYDPLIILESVSIEIFELDTAPVVCGINIGVLLGGTIDTDTSQYCWMRDDLRELGSIPNIEPYSGLGYTVTQGAGMIADPGAFIEHNYSPHDAVDWVLLELRDPNDPTQVLYSKTGMLLRAGKVYFTIELIPGYYFISLRHRNHLGIMSGMPIYLAGLGVDCNMSKATFPMYGIDSRMELPYDLRGMWPGNATPDADIKYIGIDNDRDAILVGIGGMVVTNTVTGYDVLDVNMDGVIKYAGADNDRDIILQTIGGNVPTTVRAEQIP